MPRPPRVTVADGCYHVINRGNGRAKVFHKHADFAAFERVLSLACERHSMRLLAWCLMPNHFHLVLWPRRKGDVARFMQWLTTCHVRRYHRHYRGTGHVWQGRFKCFPVEPGNHLLTVLRYVARNPVRAGLVKRAQNWKYSSTAGGKKAQATKTLDALGEQPAKPLADWLEAGPTRRPKPWLKFVNRDEDERELARLRASVNRGTPFGEDGWIMQAARKLGLESTTRPRGRPSKREQK